MEQACLTLTPERQRRVFGAVLQNIDAWLDDLTVIEAHAIPGNKARILHLMRNMVQSRSAVERLMRDLDSDPP